MKADTLRQGYACWREDVATGAILMAKRLSAIADGYTLRLLPHTLDGYWLPIRALLKARGLAKALRASVTRLR